MVTAEKRTKIVDCDTHFWNPTELWQSYIDPKYRDEVSRILAPAGPPTAAAQQIAKTVQIEQYKSIKGSDDPVERIKWMDSEGMDVNVIYPGAGKVPLHGDPHVAAAGSRALNQWAADFAAHAPDRLMPCVTVPRHPAQAVEELRHAVKLGLKVAFMAPTPAAQYRWSDPVWDPLWAEAQDAGVVVTFHEFTQAPDGDPVVARASYKHSYPFMYFCGHIVEIQLALMDVIGGGVLERFPKLQFGFIEANVAWLPGWLASMDSLWGWLSNGKRQPKGTRAMELSATEFFQRQCFIAAFPDDAWIGEVVKYVGEDTVVLCTDYPHPGTSYRMTETFDQKCPDISEEVRRKLVGGNAERIFGLGAD